MSTKAAPAGRPTIGIVADENGAVKQPSMADRQFAFLADRFAQLDALEKKVAQIEALVLQLADGLHAHRENSGQAISYFRTAVLQNSRIEDAIHRLSNHAQGAVTREEFEGVVALNQALRDEIAAFRRILQLKASA